MKRALIVSFVILAILSVAIAKRHGHGHHFPKDPELKVKLEAYKAENVLPKMTEWKSTIDNGLSSEDLTQLNALRAEARAFREKAKAEMEALKTRKEAGEDIDRSDFKTIFKDNKEEMKSVAEKLKVIVENNEELVKSVGQDAKDYRDNWHSDVRDIVRSYMEAKREEMEATVEKPERKRHRKGKHQGKNDFEMMDRGKMGMIKLLLWDGENDFNEDLELNISSLEIDSKASPNPFSTNANITFDLPRNEFVKVYVIDQSGNVVETLFEGELEAGEQTFNYSPKNASNNSVYLYKIESKSINESGKLILSK